jgi:tellurite methyltransferase
MNGGYDSGYARCPCFWGRAPGSLIRLLISYVPNLRDMKVLDAGCGEGKNAAFLSGLGATVRAIDISEVAIRNGKSAFNHNGGIDWQIGDIRKIELKEQYDIVIAYGLLHCLSSETEICEAVQKLQSATRIGGYNVVCVLNSRYQDLSAHPDLVPTLLHHRSYLDLYASWEVLQGTDTDLTESHPHNNISHTHSLTRLIARKN